MLRFLFLVIFLFPLVAKSQITKTYSTKNNSENDTVKIEEDEIITLSNQFNVDTLPTNQIKFKRNDFGSVKLQRSNKLKVALFINDMWKLKKAGPNLQDEFYLQHVAYTTYVHVLTAAGESLSYQQIVDNLLQGTRRRDFDAEILTAEYRFVNENKLLFIEISEKIKRFKVTTFYYIYIYKEGVTQISASVRTKELKYQKLDLMQLFNGFVITDKD